MVNCYYMICNLHSTNSSINNNIVLITHNSVFKLSTYLQLLVYTRKWTTFTALHYKMAAERYSSFCNVHFISYQLNFRCRKTDMFLPFYTMEDKSYVTERFVHVFFITIICEKVFLQPLFKCCICIEFSVWYLNLGICTQLIT